jgi:hypothetical protein
LTEKKNFIFTFFFEIMTNCQGGGSVLWGAFFEAFGWSIPPLAIFDSWALTQSSRVLQAKRYLGCTTRSYNSILFLQETCTMATGKKVA